VRCALWIGWAIPVVSAGCHWTLTPDDAGVQDSGTQTVGEECTEIGAEICTQDINGCGAPTTLADCMASFQPQCCIGTACDKVATVPESVVDSCKSEMDPPDCNALTNSVYPSDCQSVMSQ